MKRKNILKFVSLLGIGSFVMLAAASCSQAATRTPSSSQNSNPASDRSNMTNSMPTMNNNPSSGAEKMNNVDPELAAARMELKTLVDAQTQTTDIYVDYAKTLEVLTQAYSDAKVVLENSSSTKQSLNDAKTKLEAAISAADKSKKDFDAANTDLVAAYGALKETLKAEKTKLDDVMADEFKAIKDNLDSLYEPARKIISNTLEPKMGDKPETKNVKKVNEAINNATMLQERWKTNAANLSNSFVKVALESRNLLTTTNSNNQQPPNYSFVAFSSDVDANWSFAQRRVWIENGSNDVKPLPNPTEENATPWTDVSWIYSLSGDNTKYTLSFRYFGASTSAYLYFPYKLVKSNPNTMVGLQYKLNDAPEATDITFGSEDMMTNKTPTVNDIMVAKVALSNLKFNMNTVEFSVPSGKVAPMIGNMYLTSSDSETNRSKIYDSIFGNSLSDNNSSVTVDLLKGYSLAASHRIYVRQFNNLMTGADSSTIAPTTYLVGLIGGNLNRINTGITGSSMNTPDTDNQMRTFTVYVNAPKEGNYYISAAYLNGSDQARQITFTNATSDNNEAVTVTNLKENNWTTLGHFDTKMDSITTTNVSNMRRTIMLKQGLNKIVLSGQSGETPFISNITFSWMDAQTSGEQ